jgi:beta-glucosidase
MRVVVDLGIEQAQRDEPPIHWRQVQVAAGETVTVSLEVPASSCSLLPAPCSLVTSDGRRIVEPRQFDLLVGRSSRPTDLLRAGFTITG